MRIESTSTNPQPSSINYSFQHPLPTGNAYFENKISSAGVKQRSVFEKLSRGSFWILSYTCYFFLFPWIKLGQFFCFVGRFLREGLFCCFHFIPQESPLHWKETLEIFHKIHQIICFSKDQTINEKQQKFNLVIRELSPAALDRFQQHIVFSYLKNPKESIGCMALENPILDRVEQEKWFKENKTDIDFNAKFFNNIEKNPKILRNAVEEFYQELKRLSPN